MVEVREAARTSEDPPPQPMEEPPLEPRMAPKCATSLVNQCLSCPNAAAKSPREATGRSFAPGPCSLSPLPSPSVTSSRSPSQAVNCFQGEVPRSKVSRNDRIDPECSVRRAAIWSKTCRVHKGPTSASTHCSMQREACSAFMQLMIGMPPNGLFLPFHIFIGIYLPEAVWPLRRALAALPVRYDAVA